MRKLLFVFTFMLGACSTVPAQPPVHGSESGKTCNAAGSDRFIGQPATAQSGAEILRATNSAVLRWAPPGYMLTMDYSASRVTVRLDTARLITAINCG